MLKLEQEVDIQLTLSYTLIWEETKNNLLKELLNISKLIEVMTNFKIIIYYVCIVVKEVRP